ncbi:hypothetical protein BJ165DRAFT_1503551 [Panaeolus papilionaceus]|nr:hypothetical protein BJ165DRAFT_1503551 [Panaeolus papilionaceus]
MLSRILTDFRLCIRPDRVILPYHHPHQLILISSYIPRFVIPPKYRLRSSLSECPSAITNSASPLHIRSPVLP